MITLIPGALFLFAVLGVVEVASRTGIVNGAVIPPPSMVAMIFLQIVTSGAFVAPLLQTLELLFAGYLTGCGLALLCGILMGSFRPVYNLFEPLTELLRPIPKPALLPALILFLGLGSTMKVTVVALAAFFPVLINTIQGTRSVDVTMIDTARTFGYGKAQILWRIVLPAAAPYYLAGMRVSLAIGLVVIVMAEMLTSNGGVGATLIDMQHEFKVRQTYGWLAVLALTGFSLNALFTWIERRLTFWSAS
ncbi:MAG TPA: ABC transporter permease [Candidatus Binatia bacterium]|nr:ABC transporter permease [Candidatus Binatia bacterium]